MKMTVWMCAVAMMAVVGLTACSKQGSVEIGKLQSAFASAEPAVKQSVEKAISAIKEQNYAGALAPLQEAASKAKLTPEQEKAVNDVIAQVKEALSKAAGKAAEGAEKAVGDLKNALPK